ncbi:MAG: dihydroorotate dehydrogenase electron transfer subunit [Bacteroidaceae bacterium]|nr:dihydroorotate dehydrogenase electron transfer subunit [Bacteroidaceae bacterium]
MVKKHILDLKVSANIKMNDKFILLKLTSGEKLPEMLPGQFVEVRVDGNNDVFLRRPISINFVDEETNELWLLIQLVGKGTRTLAKLTEGDMVNVVLPLGNGFSPVVKGEQVLLIGGGAGTAPLLLYGKKLVEGGAVPTFLLGARSAADVLELDEFKKYGDVYVTTEDGSLGEKGFVTNHSVLTSQKFTRISTCGPKPMMVSVAKYAKANGVKCEASLENMMACGLGACLCCVENTTEGHLCVCKDGPVFNIEKLLWQI